MFSENGLIDFGSDCVEGLSVVDDLAGRVYSVAPTRQRCCARCRAPFPQHSPIPTPMRATVLRSKPAKQKYQKLPCTSPGMPWLHRNSRPAPSKRRQRVV